MVQICQLYSGKKVQIWQWAQEPETSNLSSTDQGMKKAECKQTFFFYISNTYDQILEENMPLSNSHFVYLGIYVFQIPMG